MGKRADVGEGGSDDGIDSGSMDKQCSARRLDIPCPVCCQNCLARGNASPGNKTMWRSADAEDTAGELESIVRLTIPESSGQIKRCISRGWIDWDEWSCMKDRHCSAILFVGKRRQRSPLTPNFCSHMVES